MAQADQQVQNAAFPAVRADINDNLAALFSQSSGASAPSVTVAFQPWIDTSSSPAVWKVRNATNTGWITVGTLDATTFAAGGVTPITSGGTGAITAAAALAALLPSQTGNSGKGLTTDGTTASWGVIAAGASLQVFTATGTYTPTAGKTTFLVFATGGGSGGAGSTNGTGYPGAGGGTAVRLYSLTEMGSTASVTVGNGGSGGAVMGTGGTTTFDPGGTGLTITGIGGGTGAPAPGGGSTNSQLTINGGHGARLITASNTIVYGASSFWGSAIGGGGTGSTQGGGSAGGAGAVFILEF
jgi:hypothetical protein